MSLTLGLGMTFGEVTGSAGTPNPLADKYIFAGAGFRALTRATTSLPAARDASERYVISQRVGGMPDWPVSELAL